jgi:hypothetical protein
VIINNAGNSWLALNPGEQNTPWEQKASVLPHLLQDGWVPVREAPMGGGTSPLAHALILLEKEPPKPPKLVRPPKPEKQEK